MPGRIVSPTLVGRAAELEALAQALDAAANGHPVHQLVAGEAGVGKSRLVSEASTLAMARGFRVLVGACADIGDGGAPYGPIGEGLRQMVRELGPDDLGSVIGSARADLARLVPSLGPSGDQATNTEFTQARLMEAVLGAVQRLSELGPLLFVVEDLHWSDPATRDTLAFLVRNVRSERLMVVMTFRSDELQRRHPLLPWLAELGRTGRVDRIDLPRFDVARTADLLAAILGERPAADFVKGIHRRSDGNPFFIEELLGAGREDGTGQLPPTLREVLLARLVALPESKQAVIRVAAVAGRGVDHDLLAAVARMQEDDLIEALRTAVAEHVLVTGTATDGDHGADYSFRHALLQEAAYDDLLPGERQRLHRAFAEALAERTPGTGAVAAGRWAELAHHWSNARDDRRAFEAFVRAGGEAMGAFAFSDSRRNDERALDLWPSVADAAEVAGMDRASLLGRAAESAMLSGDTRRSVALHREAIAALGPDADPFRLGSAYERQGRAFWLNGEVQPALDAHEMAMQIIPVDPPSPQRARAMSGYAQILMLLDRWADSEVIAAEAAAMARQVGAREAEGHALCTYGLDLSARGAGEDADVAIEAALAIAREVANADDIGRAWVNVAAARQMNGDMLGMLEKTREGALEADAVGLERTYSTFIRENGITANFELGNWEEADRLALASIDLFEPRRNQRRYGLTRWLPLLVASGDERTDAVIEELSDVLDGFRGEAQFHAHYRTGVAEHALWAGDPETARRAIEQALRELPDPHWTWYAFRLYRAGIRAAADAAEIARARRDPDAESAALDFGQRAWTLFGGLAHRASQQQGPKAAVATAAEAAIASAEYERLYDRPAAAGWAAAAAAWREYANPYLTAYCEWRQAEALLDAGERAAAAAVLNDAHMIATRLGAAPLRAAIEGLAARARVDLAAQAELSAPAAPAGPADPFGLTRRERDVLPLLVQGRTNRQIAEALFITENTAGVHVSNILGKLGAATRAEAAGIAARLGFGNA